MIILLKHVAWDFVKSGFLLGIVVAALLSGLIWLVGDVILGFDVWPFQSMARVIAIAWMIFHILVDVVRFSIVNYISAGKLARKWGVTRDEVLIAITKFKLPKEPYQRWSRGDFQQWFNIRRLVHEAARNLR